jgi:hypothetical protein
LQEQIEAKGDGKMKRKTKLKKKKKALASARARTKSRRTAKKSTRRKVSAKKRVTKRHRRKTHRPRAGADLSFVLDMTMHPPEFTDGPGSPTKDLTIFLKGENRKINIELIGETFRPHHPIKIVPYNGDTNLYNLPTSCPAPHDSLTFHANSRAKGSNPSNTGDKYTLYFGDGSLDPDIQNPGGNPKMR